MKSESEIQQLIQLEGPNWHTILMRNNSGALKDHEGRLVRYGLGNVSKKHNDQMKSSDLIGIKTIVITPDMVGQMVAVFTAIEVKREDWKRDEENKKENAQFNFIEWIKKRGGIAGFASSVKQFVDTIRNAHV